MVCDGDHGFVVIKAAIMIVVMVMMMKAMVT